MKDSSNATKLLESYPDQLRIALLALRSLILDTAGQYAEIGPLEETLKWGQPSYSTRKPKTGTAVRIDRDRSGRGDYALFVNCQSSLVSEWRVLFPHMVFSGNRGVHFSLGEPLPQKEVRHMVAMALTYHKRKRTRSRKNYRPML